MHTRCCYCTTVLNLGPRFPLPSRSAPENCHPTSQLNPETIPADHITSYQICRARSESVQMRGPQGGSRVTWHTRPPSPGPHTHRHGGGGLGAVSSAAGLEAGHCGVRRCPLRPAKTGRDRMGTLTANGGRAPAQLSPAPPHSADLHASAPEHQPAHFLSLYNPPPPPPALCDIPSGCSFFTGPWTAGSLMSHV